MVVLFVLSCKKSNFLRDICDFDSYISYKGYFTFIQFPIHLSQIMSVLAPVLVVFVQPAAALRLLISPAGLPPGVLLSDISDMLFYNLPEYIQAVFAGCQFVPAVVQVVPASPAFAVLRLRVRRIRCLSALQPVRRFS